MVSSTRQSNSENGVVSMDPKRGSVFFVKPRVIDSVCETVTVQGPVDLVHDQRIEHVYERVFYILAGRRTKYQPLLSFQIPHNLPQPIASPRSYSSLVHSTSFYILPRISGSFCWALAMPVF